MHGKIKLLKMGLYIWKCIELKCFYFILICVCINEINVGNLGFRVC